MAIFISSFLKLKAPNINSKTFILLRKFNIHVGQFVVSLHASTHSWNLLIVNFSSWESFVWIVAPMVEDAPFQLQPWFYGFKVEMVFWGMHTHNDKNGCWGMEVMECTLTLRKPLACDLFIFKWFRVILVYFSIEHFCLGKWINIYKKDII